MHGKVETPESLFPSRTYSKRGRRRGREARGGGGGRGRRLSALAAARAGGKLCGRCFCGGGDGGGGGGSGGGGGDGRRCETYLYCSLVWAAQGTTRGSALHSLALAASTSRLIGQRAPPFKTTSSPGHWLRAS